MRDSYGNNSSPVVLGSTSKEGSVVVADYYNE